MPNIDYMGRALELAERALGWCSPNPAVGAVLVRDAAIVGEGWTQRPGEAHAEIVALRQAGPAASGATLYVTLEPCSHYGRTPPCDDALVAAGVASVHAAMTDASPWVDGKIATHTGSSSWITGREARGHVAQLRARVDAVLVGIGTVLADDPRLTARPEEFGLADDRPVHQPLRVVLDSEARLPLDSKMVSGDLPGSTLLMTTARAPRERVDALRDRGVEAIILAADDGRVPVCGALEELGQRGVTSVLAECGGTLAASLLAAGAVDKVAAFVAPKIAGGEAAPTPVGGRGVELMRDALQLGEPAWTVLGPDVLLTGYVAPPAAESA